MIPLYHRLRAKCLLVDLVRFCFDEGFGSRARVALMLKIMLKTIRGQLLTDHDLNIRSAYIPPSDLDKSCLNIENF
jgi:hypothetical protein